MPDRLPSSTVPPHLLTPGPDLTSALEPAMRRSTLTSHPEWESLMGLTACKSLELNRPRHPQHPLPQPKTHSHTHIMQLTWTNFEEYRRFSSISGMRIPVPVVAPWGTPPRTQPSPGAMPPHAATHTPWRAPPLQACMGLQPLSAITRQATPPLRIHKELNCYLAMRFYSFGKLDYHTPSFLLNLLSLLLIHVCQRCLHCRHELW